MRDRHTQRGSAEARRRVRRARRRRGRRAGAARRRARAPRPRAAARRSGAAPRKRAAARVSAATPSRSRARRRPRHSSFSECQGVSASRVSGHGSPSIVAASLLQPCPIYEYRCPNGHASRRSSGCPIRRRRRARCAGGAGREGAVPGGGALQGLRLLLDRLRLVGEEGAEGRRLARGGDTKLRLEDGHGHGREEAPPRTDPAQEIRPLSHIKFAPLARHAAACRSPADARQARRRSYEASVPDRAAGAERARAGRRWLRRRAAGEHRERGDVVLAAEDHRLAADRGRVAAEPAVERAAAVGPEAQPPELQQLAGADRSVVSGLTRSSPMNGSRKKVLTPSPCSRCRRAPAAARVPRQVVVGRVEPVLADARVDQRPPAVHLLLALAEAPAFPGRAAPGVERAVEVVRDDLPRTSTVMPPSVSITPLKSSKSTIAMWFTSSPVSCSIVRSASAGPPIWNALLIFARRRRGSTRAGREGSRGRRSASIGVGADQHDRVRAAEARATRRAVAVGAEQQDLRRLGQSRPSCGVSACSTLAGRRSFASYAASHGQVAEHGPQHDEERRASG